MDPRSRIAAIHERAALRASPIHAMWELTHRCPLSCRHCFLAGRAPEEELRTEEAKGLLREMARLGVLFLTFTGGEPLLRPDLFELVDEARRLGFSWRLFTSGLPLDQRCVGEIAERQPLAVDISLHGLEPTHEAITSARGSFRAAVDAMRELAARGVRVIAKMSLTPQGLSEMGEVRALCDRTGAALQVATLMFPDCEGCPVDEGLSLADGDLEEYFARQEADCPTSFGHRRPLGPDQPLCGAGRSGFAVSPGGDVRACLTLDGVCGNVRKTPLAEIWDSEPMRRYRRFRAGDRVRCRTCLDVEFCYYCPGMAEKQTGDPLGAPASICREASVRRRLYLRALSASRCQCI